MDRLKSLCWNHCDQQASISHSRSSKYETIPLVTVEYMTSASVSFDVVVEGRLRSGEASTSVLLSYEAQFSFSVF